RRGRRLRGAGAEPESPRPRGLRRALRSPAERRGRARPLGPGSRPTATPRARERAPLRSGVPHETERGALRRRRRALRAPLERPGRASRLATTPRLDGPLSGRRRSTLRAGLPGHPARGDVRDLLVLVVHLRLALLGGASYVLEQSVRTPRGHHALL